MQVTSSCWGVLPTKRSSSAQNRCVDSFAKTGTILIGEMAHVLAHGKKGPRRAGTNQDNVDTYSNLVLLCPHHHTIVDKAPDDFPAESLKAWKSTLEDRVDKAIDIPVFSNTGKLFEYAHSLLRQNKFIHTHFGPQSESAQARPFSNLQKLWEAKKTEEIIPNNSLIVAAFRRYSKLLTAGELRAFGRFEAHAIAFAANAEDRQDSAPMFPVAFGKMVARKER